MDFPEPVSEANKNCRHCPGVVSAFGNWVAAESGCLSNHFRLRDWIGVGLASLPTISLRDLSKPGRSGGEVNCSARGASGARTFDLSFDDGASETGFGGRWNPSVVVLLSCVRPFGVSNLEWGGGSRRAVNLFNQIFAICDMKRSTCLAVENLVVQDIACMRNNVCHYSRRPSFQPVCTQMSVSRCIVQTPCLFHVHDHDHENSSLILCAYLRTIL